LSQEFQDKKNLAAALQDENVKYRAQLTQLKKDGKRLLNDMEQVLHPDTCADFANLPKNISTVLAKHQHLNCWQPTVEEAPSTAADPFADAGKEASIIEEMIVQRDLIFRKNQIAVGAASQSKRDCAQDVGKLTSENAALIAEMNTLRNERKSWQRSYKELEARTMAQDALNNAQARLSGKGGDSMNRSSSAPGLESSKGSVGGTGKPRSREGGAADTPYKRRKDVDQQEVYRRQKVKGQSSLPPVNPSGTMPAAAAAETRMKPTNQEKTFGKSMDEVQAGRRQMERQGFDMSSLSSQAEAMAHLPVHGVTEPGAIQGVDVPESFPAADGIQD